MKLLAKIIALILLELSSWLLLWYFSGGVTAAGLDINERLGVWIAYFFGSIPFGLLFTKIFADIDVRTLGSGNIGATNVLRTGRKGLAVATLLCDLLKGAFVVYIAKMAGNPFDVQLLMGAMAVVGHMYPVWLDFKGGKGIATILGVALALSWKVALIAACVWLGMVALKRISSLASLSAVTIAPLAGYFLEGPRFAAYFAGLAVLIYSRHRENIRRLIQGKEPRIGEKS